MSTVTPAPPSPPATAHPTKFELAVRIWRTLVLWVWKIGSFFALAIWYIAVVSEGWRLQFANTTVKLYKLPIPLFDLLGDDMTYRRLDVAHGCSLVLLCVTYWSTNNYLRAILCPGAAIWRGWDPALHLRFTQILCFVFLGFDAFLFYRASSQLSGWGNVTFSFTAVVATVIYVAVLVFASFFTVTLEAKAKEKS